jgi:hypothetical protein
MRAFTSSFGCISNVGSVKRYLSAPSASGRSYSSVSNRESGLSARLFFGFSISGTTDVSYTDSGLPIDSAINVGSGVLSL